MPHSVIERFESSSILNKFDNEVSNSLDAVIKMRHIMHAGFNVLRTSVQPLSNKLDQKPMEIDF